MTPATAHDEDRCPDCGDYCQRSPAGTTMPCDAELKAYAEAVVAAARAYRDADEALRRHTQERASWRDALNKESATTDKLWRLERNRLTEEVARRRIALNTAALEG